MFLITVLRGKKNPFAVLKLVAVFLEYREELDKHVTGNGKTVGFCLLMLR